jgi:hypothetical protein
MGMRNLGFFLLGAIFFAACGTAEIPFKYKFFHLSPMRAWEYPGGELIGQGVKHPLTDCKPFKNNKGEIVQKCVVVFYEELNKFVKDYKNTKQQLIDCQRGSK